MFKKTNRIIPVFVLTCFTLSFFTFALDYGTESVENYSGCGCSSANLWQCNDQAEKFDAKMASYGHVKKFRYEDNLAWPSDLAEDLFGGQDNYFGDNVHILLVSAHGSCTFTGGYTGYQGYLCPGLNVGPNENGTTFVNYLFDASQLAFGDYSYSNFYWGPYSYPYPGKLRFLILCTCHSVEESSAGSQWGPVFYRTPRALGDNYPLVQFMFVMGYSGTSTDSPTTDEVGADFASKAAGSNWALRDAWFYAVEDWWCNDIGACVSTSPNLTTVKLNTEPPLFTSGGNGVTWQHHHG